MIYGIIKYKISLTSEKSVEKNWSYEINHLVYYFVFILVLIFTILKQFSIVMTWVLILIKRLVFILKKLMIKYRVKDMQFFNRYKKFRYHNSFFFFFLVIKIISLFSSILFSYYWYQVYSYYI